MKYLFLHERSPSPSPIQWYLFSLDSVQIKVTAQTVGVDRDI